MQLTVNLGTDSRYHSVRSRWILDNFATFSCWETRITFQWFICRLYFFWGDELCNGSKISSECAIEPQYTLIIIGSYMRILEYNDFMLDKQTHFCLYLLQRYSPGMLIYPFYLLSTRICKDYCVKITTVRK